MILLVGDLQGCLEPFERLLAETGFSPSRDRLVLLGDLVNRGPSSLALLRRVIGLDGAARCVLGNHDLHLVAVAHGVRARHRRDTFGDVLGASDALSLVDWLRRQPLALEETGWLCVHAGLVPQWTVQQALALADEVQSVLRGPDLGGFLRQMYGNDPRRWDAALAGAARWRFVVNVLTRIRFCGGDGTLDFETKEGAAAAPPGLRPWFEVPGRASAGQPIACGHWSTLGLVQRPDLLALDTGCVWGGCLSAVRVDGGRREVVQVPCEQAQSPG
jgi:bis(5'-nucleosyl)-tetraphosphatase (symmetrical)